MSTTIVDYLKSFFKKSENIKDLLSNILLITKSKKGAIFTKENDYNKYTCIEYIGKNNKNIETVTLENVLPINNVLINNDGTKNYGFYDREKTNKIIVIPVKTENNVLGIICLANSETDYKICIYETLEPWISLLQILLRNHNLVNECNKTYCNNTFDSKDLFLANMSHEIRTPLNGVLGYNQLLLQTPVTVVQKEYLKSLNQCSLQLMTIINDILDFSKLTSGKMELVPECFNLKEIKDSVSEAMGTRLQEKRQKFIFDIMDNVPTYILLDKRKLIQILVNLVSNASKFTKIEGEIKIHCSSNQQNQLTIKVIDNGIGISKQDQLKLFNAFVQIEESTYKQGSGLGLAISKKLVELLGGNITVKSTLGEGSTFIFTIKFKEYTEIEKKMNTNMKTLKDKVVLVVDDNADNRIMLSELLFSWNMKPVICASALEALRMILGNRYKFDLGLIDICMPGTSGTELAEQIKEERPFFPLIALSSLGTFITSTNFEEKLDKPINKIQLFNAIFRVIIKSKKINSYIGEEKIEKQINVTCSTQNFNKNSKILIIEDINYNQEVLKNMLNILQYNNINIAENGKIAFDMIKESYSQNIPYDLLLLDLRLPIMNGFEVIEAIKQMNWKLPKIIIITASTMKQDIEKCKQYGIKYFINKPIEINQLKEVILYSTEEI